MDTKHLFTGVDDATLALCHRAGLSEAETSIFSTIKSAPPEGLTSVELVNMTQYVSLGALGHGINAKMEQAGFPDRVTCERHGRRFVWTHTLAVEGRAA